MKLLHQWALTLAGNKQTGIPKSFRVQGSVDKHLSAHWMKAGAIVIFEPSDELAMDLAKVEKTGELYEFARSFLFGVLDKTMIDRHPQISNFRASFVEIQYDEIHSSILAFRVAGRDAGAKLLKLLRNQQ
jgi:hypothetical protein